MSGNKLEHAVIEFAQVLLEYDLFVTEINSNGRMQRCKAMGDSRSEKSGAYFIKPDYPYNYYVINFRQTISHKGNFKELKDTNYKRLFKPTIQRSVTSDEDNLLQQNKRAYYAYKLFQNGLSDFAKLQNNDYLARKKVLPFSIRYDAKSALIIPGRDVNDKIWTLQFILPDGTKRFLAKTRKLGCLHKVGWTKLSSNYSSDIFIAEGYATAASIHIATDKPAVVAFDASNMINVGKDLRAAFPSAQLIFCLDVDYAGINYGLKAAIESIGKVVLPFLSTDNLASKMNDFNDLHCISGLNEVNYQIYLQIPHMKLILTQAYQLLHNEISIDNIDPKFHNLAEKYIFGYYISDVANKINQLSKSESQYVALLGINESYRNNVKCALVKLSATQYFYNKKDYHGSFLLAEIKEFITSSMIDQVAKKISEEISIEIRRSQINKINPMFQSEVKQRLNYYWQLRKNLN